MDTGGKTTRRRWLCTLAAATGGLAGCSAPRGGDDPPGDASTGSERTPTTTDGETTHARVETSWPTFRGDARNTGCAMPARGPVDFPTRKWAVPTGGGVWSSPVVVDGRVYVGCMDRRLYAIDAATGEVDWTYETGGPVQSTPTVADGRVYFGSFDKHVYCLDAATGEERWSYETAGLVNGSARVTDSELYIGTGTIGVSEVHDFLESSGIEQEGGGLYALDRETGELLWRQFPTHLISSTPALVGSTLYIGLTIAPDDPPQIAALDAADGSVRWNYVTDSAVITSPTVHSGTVYCPSYGGIVYALAADTGDVEWRYNIGPGDIRGSTAVCDGSVYVPASGNVVARGSDNPVLYSLSLDGHEQWTHEIAGGRQMGSSPAVTSDAVYVGTHYLKGGGGMYAVSHDGARLWSEKLSDGEGVGSSPAVVDGTVYYGADANTVYAME